MTKPLPLYRPMLATRVDPGEVRADWFSEWVEMKWDGYRCLAYIDKGHTRLISRNGKDISPAFRELLNLHRQIDGRRAVLDGEIVAFGDDGHPSFARLVSAPSTAVYVVFDLLHLDDDSLVRLPLYQRRRVLEGVISGDDRIQLSETVAGLVPEIVRAVEKMNMEGVIVKDPASPYFPGRRSPSWKKIKCRRTMLARVIGFTAKAGTVRALLLATAEQGGGKLRYAGRVGSGFTEKERRELVVLLQPLTQRRPPIDPVPEDVPPDAIWIDPQPVCRVAYLEFSPYGRLRHPTFAGWEQPPRTVFATRS